MTEGIDWAVCLVCSSLLSNQNDNISTRRSVLIIYHPFSLKHPHDLFLPHLFLFSFFFFTSFFDIFHTFFLLPILPNYVHPSAGGGAWSIRINSGNSDVLTGSKKIFANKNRRETFVKDLFLRTINAIGVARNHLKFSVLCKAKEIIRYNIE